LQLAGIHTWVGLQPPGREKISQTGEQGRNWSFGDSPQERSKEGQTNEEAAGGILSHGKRRKMKCTWIIGGTVLKSLSGDTKTKKRTFP